MTRLDLFFVPHTLEGQEVTRKPVEMVRAFRRNE